MINQDLGFRTLNEFFQPSNCESLLLDQPMQILEELFGPYTADDAIFTEQMAERLNIAHRWAIARGLTLRT